MENFGLESVMSCSTVLVTQISGRKLCNRAQGENTRYMRRYISAFLSIDTVLHFCRDPLAHPASLLSASLLSTVCPLAACVCLDSLEV